MIRFLVRRLGVVALQIVLVTLIAYALFFVVSAATGATPEQRVAGRTATPEQVARVAEILGTDRPVYEQYLRFLGGVVQGDFGYSFAYRQPVSNLLFPAAGVTAARSTSMTSAPAPAIMMSPGRQTLGQSATSVPYCA